MTTFTIRLSLILLLLFTLPIATMRLIGEQINPYYGLGMFASVTENDEIVGTITYTDLTTQVSFTVPVRQSSITEQVTLLDPPTNLMLPDTTTTIASTHTWSPQNTLLLITDTDKRVWIYNTQSDSYHSLPSNYQINPFGTHWSNSGERFVVTRPVEDYVVEVGLYTLADDSYLPLFQHLQVQNGFQTPAIPRVQWSPDDRVVFVSPPSLTTTIQYTLYDTMTGEIILEHSAISNSRSNKTFFWVSY
ncbi:MAG: hypothetical protein AAF846_20840 [Chloroflexota bacterium]